MGQLVTITCTTQPPVVLVDFKLTQDGGAFVVSAEDLQLVRFALLEQLATENCTSYVAGIPAVGGLPIHTRTGQPVSK
jgi:hypothetical protein